MPHSDDKKECDKIEHLKGNRQQNKCYKQFTRHIDAIPYRFVGCYKRADLSTVLSKEKEDLNIDSCYRRAVEYNEKNEDDPVQFFGLKKNKCVGGAERPDKSSRESSISCFKGCSTDSKKIYEPCVVKGNIGPVFKIK